MKLSTVILAVGLALLCFGCGEDDSTVTAGAANASEENGPRFPTLSDGSDPRFATITPGEDGPRDEPEVDPSDLAPPKRLLIRELEVGSGAVAEPGDEVAVRYLGIIYETGELFYRGWLYPPSLRVRLQPGGEAWEEGVWGMRVGGRREMVVPSHLAFGSGAIDYVVELVRIEPASEPPSG
jgi:peptidylprolyl isomerase